MAVEQGCETDKPDDQMMCIRRHISNIKIGYKEDMFALVSVTTLLDPIENGHGPQDINTQGQVDKQSNYAQAMFLFVSVTTLLDPIEN